MPYSDNLYSAWDDESDGEAVGQGLTRPESSAHESHVQTPQQSRSAEGHDVFAYEAGGPVDDDGVEDIYSPTDGYFQGSTTSHTTPSRNTQTASYVPNVMVQDPSLAQGSTAESKAREADQERLANQPSTPPNPSSTPIQAPSVSRYSPSSAYRGPTPLSSVGRDTYSQPSSSAYTYAPSTATSSTSYTPQQVTYDGRSPFLPGVPREAPPAYTPSPTSPTSSSSNAGDASRNYSTFTQPTPPADNMGNPSETQALLAREPESMGGPNNAPDGAAPSWSGRLRRRVSALDWKKSKVVLLALALLFVSFGFITTGIQSGIDEGGKLKDPTNPPPYTPPGRGDDTPDDDFMDYPGLDGDFDWGTKELCKDAIISRGSHSYGLDFGSGKKLHVTQDVPKDSHQHPVSVRGIVILRRTGPNTPGPSVVVDTIVNDERLDVGYEWDATAQKLRVTAPADISWKDNKWPCVHIIITIWVPEDGTLDALKVEAIHLGILLLDNLSLTVSKSARLTSVVGRIVASSAGSNAKDDNDADVGAPGSFRFSSRFIEVENTSGDIFGSWPLFDYLRLSTTSGDIVVAVEPKEAGENPVPANLVISSLSGDVTFREPIKAAEDAFVSARSLSGSETALRAESVLPPRDYRVDVQTTSGNIRGGVAFSSSARVESISGRIQMELLPVLDSSLAEDGGRQASLKTGSASGGAHITLNDPLWIDSSKGVYVVLPPLSSGQHPPPRSPGKDDTYTPIGKIGNGDPYASLPRGGGGSSSVKEVQTRDEDKSTAAVAAVAARALRCLSHKHGSTSGNVTLKYPGTWEGGISAESMSGSIKVRGKDVVIVKEGREWPGYGHYVKAKKGDEGGGKLAVDTTSGNVYVVVGEE